MKFGVFSVSMPEYGIEESVRLLKELGYDGVEWRVAEMPEKEPENVPFALRYWACNKSTLELRSIEAEAAKAKALCDEAGLEIFGLTTYLATNELEPLTRVFHAARSIGCRQVRVGLVPYNPAKADAPYPVLFARMREDLKAIDALAAETGVKAVLEIHMDTLISSPSAAYRALEGFDPAHIGLIFDPGNMVNEGFEDYQKSFELLGDYIAHIHIKNGILAPDGEDELGACKWKRVWTPLKKGMADLKKLFAVARKAGYDGTFSIEDFSNDEATPDKLRENIAYLKALAASGSGSARATVAVYWSISSRMGMLCRSILCLATSASNNSSGPSKSSRWKVSSSATLTPPSQGRHSRWNTRSYQCSRCPCPAAPTQCCSGSTGGYPVRRTTLPPAGRS